VISAKRFEENADKRTDPPASAVVRLKNSRRLVELPVSVSDFVGLDSISL